jgi:hypothetical protein
LAVLAIDVGCPALEFHLRDVAQRDVGGGQFRIAIRYRDRHGADSADVIAIARSQSDGQREIHLAFVDARDFLSTDRGLYDGVDVADRDAVTRCLRAVYSDDQIWLADEIERRWVSYTGYLPDCSLDRLGQTLQLGEIASENLHRILALHPGHRLFDVVLNVLREIEIDAHDLAVEPFAHLRDQFLLGQTRRPFVERLQGHEELHEKGAVRIGAVLAAALLGKYRPHRLVAPNDIANACNGVDAGFQRDRRRHDPADPQVALFELRQKLGAQPGREDPADGKECEGDRGRQTVMTHG